MKRTKAWWNRLNADERAALVALERASSRVACGSSYLPDDCVECPSCGNPSLSGLCNDCDRQLDLLLGKANDQPTGPSQ